MSFKQVIPPPEDMEKIRLELMKVALPEAIRAAHQFGKPYVAVSDIAEYASAVVDATLTEMYGAA